MAEPEPQRTPTQSTQVAEVFGHFLAAWGKTPARYRLTPQRSARIKARLREGYSAEDLKHAIDGAKLDPHLMGQSKHGGGTVYADRLQTVLRDGEQVERLRDLARKDAGRREEVEARIRKPEKRVILAELWWVKDPEKRAAMLEESRRKMNENWKKRLAAIEAGEV